MTASSNAPPDAPPYAPPYALPEALTCWFAARGWKVRRHQIAMLEAARAGRDALLVAPTGSGKTLAGFLPSLVDLAARRVDRRRGGGGLHTLYLSPLKALAVDVARNLSGPAAALDPGLRIETRTGDTPPARRRRQMIAPPDILLTTPEQLALMLAAPEASDLFAGLRRIVVDEVHALAPGKRGDLLSLCLSALRNLAPLASRAGLSATVADPPELQAWLTGGGPGPSPRLADLVAGAPGAAAEVGVLLPDGRIPWAGHTGRHAMADLYRAIQAAGTSLVFVNTRFQAELAFQELWRINTDNLPIALHHGSLDVERRRKVEAAMAEGRLKAVVCTSTLDLGVDWGDVDLVVQLGAPKGAARLVQRIGRANHRLDTPSRALLVPGNRFEMLECAAALDALRAGEMDAPPPRRGALDILAQHIMGRAVAGPFHPAALYDEVRAAWPYRDLSAQTFERVLGFVRDGGYALAAYDRFARLRPLKDGRLVCRNAEHARRWRMNVGAIVADPVLKVRVAGRAGAGRRRAAGRAGAVAAAPAGGPLVPGRVVGEIEEYFVQGLKPGDTFLFAGEIWRLEGVEDDACLVTRAAGVESPKVPSWAGGKFPLSTFLAGRVRQMVAEPDRWPDLHPQAREWLEAQRDVSALPRPGELLVETFARAARFHLACYPFEGRLAHQTLGMLLTRRLERAGLEPMGFVANDYALSVWGQKDMAGADMDRLFDQDMLGDDLEEWLAESVLMKRTFRNCAVISGLIEQRIAGGERRARQITFSSDLIFDVLAAHQPDHILLEATRQDAGEGLLDISRLADRLAAVAGRLRHMRLDRISPFAVPLMLEIGKVPIHGEARERVIEEAAGEALWLEALSERDQPRPR